MGLTIEIQGGYHFFVGPRDCFRLYCVKQIWAYRKEITAILVSL